MFGHILAMSNSCCNPFIYGIYNVSLSIFACIISDPELRNDFFLFARALLFGLETGSMVAILCFAHLSLYQFKKTP